MEPTNEQDWQTQFIIRASQEAVNAYINKPVFSPVIAVAQSILESNWGRSQLATMANNIKGVKAGSRWRGATIDLPTREQRPDGSEYTTTARWRVYESWSHAFEDYAIDIVQRVYPWAAEIAQRDPYDHSGFLRALLIKPMPKYATDINYFSLVMNLVSSFNLVERLEAFMHEANQGNVPTDRKQYEMVEFYTVNNDKTLFEAPIVVSLDNEPVNLEGRKLQLRFLTGDIKVRHTK